MAGDTRERILQESLKLFSTSGFEAISIRTIAAQVQVTNSALYKHFKTKQEIFDALVAQCMEHYQAKMTEATAMLPSEKIAEIATDSLVRSTKGNPSGSASAEDNPSGVASAEENPSGGASAEENPSGGASAENILSEIIQAVHQVCFAMFHYQTSDPELVMFRRMLLIEKFRNPELAALYKEFFVDIPLARLTKIYSGLLDLQIMRPGDPHVYAMKMYAPFYMYHFIDHDETVLLPRLQEHIESFIRAYTMLDTTV